MSDTSPYTVYDHKSGDVICTNCGLILEERFIDQHSEWRTFSDETGAETRDRGGGPTTALLRGEGLSTVIAPTDRRSGKGAGILTGAMIQMHVNSSMSSFDRSLSQAYDEIKSMGAKLELNLSVQEHACEIYHEVAEAKPLRGKNVPALIAACLFIACRRLNEDRTFKDIYTRSETPRKHLLKTLNWIKKTTNIPVDPVSPGKFVKRYCEQLELPKPVQQATEQVAGKIASESWLGGRNTVTVCAVALYFVTQMSQTEVTYADIAEVTGIAEQTIRSAYQVLYPHRDSLRPFLSAFPAHSFPQQ
jgi:transcription initiation factor TFIIB